MCPPPDRLRNSLRIGMCPPPDRLSRFESQVNFIQIIYNSSRTSTRIYIILATTSNNSNNSSSTFIIILYSHDHTSQYLMWHVTVHFLVNHVVRVGVDGYCNENDDYPEGAAADDMQLDMPESMAVLCSVCEAPDGHGNTVWHVTKPHDRVGAFDCLKLDGLGKEGRISGSQCHMFQQMIQANNLCGCIAPSSTTSTTSSSASDVTDPQDDDVLFYADHDEENAPYTPSSVASVAEGSSFDTRSSGSSKPILAITSAAASVIAYLAAA